MSKLEHSEEMENIKTTPERAFTSVMNNSFIMSRL